MGSVLTSVQACRRQAIGVGAGPDPFRFDLFRVQSGWLVGDGILFEFADWASGHALTIIIMNLGILLFPQVEELDFVGPWEMATMWQAVAKPGELVPSRCLLVAQGPDPITCAKGMQVLPQTTFADCPNLDVLLVPGGQGTRQEVNNPVLIDFVARQAAQAKVLISVCTGAFVLHAAGCLGGKRATTHWGSLQRLRELGDVTVVEERWVRDGVVWTSAGVSAGMDVMLAVIADLAGDEVAGRVQFASEYYPAPHRYGNFTEHPGMPTYARSGAVSTS